MGDYGRKRRVFAGNDEIENVILTMCGEGNVLDEVGAVEYG